MISRRELLQAGLLAGPGLLLKPKGRGPQMSHRRHGAFTKMWAPREPSASTGPAPFVDPLPVPSVLKPVPNQIVQIPMVQFQMKAHRNLPPTTLWGYRAAHPGPTLEVRRGAPINVRWTNNLPTTHPLPIDPSIHGAGPGMPQVRTVVHLHGHKVLPESDGYPEAWFTSNGLTGPDFNPNPYHYPNDQPATTLWYHDHGLGITRLNLYMGLKGFYLIRDDLEDSLNLPKGPFEIPLMIEDRMFNPDGSLLYPTAVGGTHPVWIPEFFGDTMLVNGKVWPFLEVQPRKYRFRFLNTCNARFLHLTLMESDAAGNPTGNPGPAFFQIGTDGGLLPHPVRLSDVLFGTAERIDVVIDFSERFGKSFVLLNDAPAPFPDGGEIALPNVMLFKVTRPLSGPDTSSLPSQLASFPLLDPASATRTRQIALTELDRDSDGFPIIAQLGQMHWDDPVTENPRAGSTEVWELINTTGDGHPIHVHLVQFQILNRQPFDVDTYLNSGQLVLTGPPQPPDPNERPALKDTIRAMPGFVNRLIAKFDLPTGTTVQSGQKFRYVFHCHIAEHEDNEMMRPYDVVAP